jgi:hypothetical protein
LVETDLRTTSEVEEDFSQQGTSPDTCSPLTPLSSDYTQLANSGMTMTQALDKYHVATQPAPISPGPADRPCSSLSVGNRYRVQQHQPWDSFLLGRGWNSDDNQGPCLAPMQTGEHTQFRDIPQNSIPLSDYFNMPAMWSQRLSEECDVFTQQSPLQLGQSPATQLGQRLDCFSPGMDQSVGISSAPDCLAEFSVIIE